MDTGDGTHVDTGTQGQYDRHDDTAVMTTPRARTGATATATMISTQRDFDFSFVSDSAAF